MSANLNVSAPEHPKRVLLIVGNPATSSLTGWPVGFWWSELSHPFWAFTEAGYSVDIRSPDGGSLVADAYSDPRDPSGYSAHDLLSLGFLHSPTHAALLSDTRSIADVDVALYDAVFVVGGQSPMFTFRGHNALTELVAAFYSAGRITALVCHATCLLLDVTNPDGSLLVSGKTWTGFANSEEAFADAFVGRRLQPFWIEEEARAIAGTNFVVEQPFRPFAVRDGLLVTGQQQYSGAAAAEMVIRALGR